MQESLSNGSYYGLAKSTGLSQSHISRILRGMNGFTFDSACKIADAAGVTLEQLREHIRKESANRKRRETIRRKQEAA